MTEGFGHRRCLAPRHDASHAIRVPRVRILPSASFRSHLTMGTLAVRLGVPVIKASKGLAPSRHFPVGFRLPVDSARQGAARHAWRTSSSPGGLLPRGPHQNRTRRFPPSGSSADVAHGDAPQIRTRIRGTALVRGCGQAYALQTVEPVTYRCGTRRVCQARSSGSERDTRARPHAVAPMNCVPEDSRRRSTCTGSTHSPRARADGTQTPASTVAVRAPSPS